MTRPDLVMQKDFLELSPPAVARFLHERSSGLAKEKVGEYLGNLQSPFAMKVLACFLQVGNIIPLFRWIIHPRDSSRNIYVS